MGGESIDADGFKVSASQTLDNNTHFFDVGRLFKLRFSKRKVSVTVCVINIIRFEKRYETTINVFKVKLFYFS